MEMKMVTLTVVLILLQVISTSLAYQLDVRDVNIQCQKEGFIVTINKEQVGGELTVFSFIDPSCRSTSNGSHLVGATEYTQCGTIKRESEDGVGYTNALLNPYYEPSVASSNIDDIDDALCPHLKIEVTCFVPNQLIGSHSRKRRSLIEGRVQKTKGCPPKYAFDSPNDINSAPEYVTCPFLIGIGETLQPDHILKNTHVTTAIKMKNSNNASPCKPLNRRGKDIRLIMSLHKDRTFKDYYDQGPPSASLTYADVFYKIQHLSGHDNFKMVPMTCYATPNPNPENPIRYDYIKKGCPVDPTVKFYNSPDNDGTSRFSITSFQFVDTESRAFYSHCSVLVCDKSDQSEQCNPPCQQQQQQRLALNAPIRSKRTRRSYKIVKTKDGKFRLVRVRKSCYRFIQSQRINKMNVIFNVMIPRNSRFLKKKRPFSIVPVKTTEENSEDITFKLKPVYGSTYSITKCTFGQRRSDLILKDGRSLRDSKYAGLINIHQNDIISIAKKHENFDLEKQYSKLICKIVVCEQGQDCSKVCPSLNRTPRRVRKSITQQVGDSKNIEVDCLADRMIIRIKKSSSNTFYLNDPKCSAKFDGTFITLATPYNKCGTKFVEKGNKFYYTNEIVEKVPDSLKIIRGPLLKQQVNCALKKSIQSSAAIRLKRKRLRASGVGSYKVEIDMYTDETFKTRNLKSLVEIDENQNMYFGVKVKSKAFRDTLEIHLDTCLGYNQPKNGEDRKTHVFIKNGCPRDKTVRFYHNKDASEVRFSVKPFKFDGETSIMVNCFVTACSINDKDSKCKQMKNSKDICK